MFKLTKQALGKVTQSRTALIVFAAAALTGGTVSEASARPYRHHHHHHHHAHHVRADNSWRNANASVGSSFGGGHSFSGVASYYGNESGRKTASGQRFNQEAMTAAHRSLPFGTRLRVTHGIRGRVLDLSTGAARAIGLTGAGVGRVTAEVVS
jgi:rare lipoprotein A